MKNKTAATAIVLALLMIVLGCGRLAQGLKGNLLEADGAAKAAKAIKAKVGSERVDVIRLEIRPDEMEVTIRSPKNPKDIDKYTYKGGSVSGPEPVQIISFGSNEMTGDKYQATEIDDIGFAAIPATIKEAIDISKLEDAKVSLISMDYQVPDGGTIGESKLVFKWRLFVEGPRGRKDFWADQYGKLNPKSF